MKKKRMPAVVMFKRYVGESTEAFIGRIIRKGGGEIIGDVTDATTAASVRRLDTRSTLVPHLFAPTPVSDGEPPAAGKPVQYAKPYLYLDELERLMAHAKRLGDGAVTADEAAAMGREIAAIIGPRLARFQGRVP